MKCAEGSAGSEYALLAGGLTLAGLLAMGAVGGAVELGIAGSTRGRSPDAGGQPESQRRSAPSPLGAGPSVQAGAASAFGRFARDAEGLTRLTRVSDVRRAIGDVNMLEAFDGVWDAVRAGDEEISPEIARAWLADEGTDAPRPVHATQTKTGPDEWGISFPTHRMRDHMSTAELGRWAAGLDDAVVDLGHALSREGDHALLGRLRKFLRGDTSPLRRAPKADRVVDVSEVVPLQSFRAEVLDQMKRLTPYNSAWGIDADVYWFRYDPAALPSDGFDRLRRIADAVRQYPELNGALSGGSHSVGFVDLGKWQPDLKDLPFVSAGAGKLLVNIGEHLDVAPERILSVLEDELVGRRLHDTRTDLPVSIREQLPALESPEAYRALLRERLPNHEGYEPGTVRVWRSPLDERARDIAPLEPVSARQAREDYGGLLPAEASFPESLVEGLRRAGFEREAELFAAGGAVRLEAAPFRALSHTEELRKAPLKLPRYVTDPATGRFFLNLDAGGPFPLEAFARFIRHQSGGGLQ